MISLLEQDLWTLAVVKNEIKNAIGDLSEASEEAISEAVDRKASEIMDYIDEELSHLTSFSKQIVDTLPDPADADPNTIYFVPKDPSSPDTEYIEYIKIGDKMEKIGSTDINLSNDLIDNETLSTNSEGKITVVNIPSSSIDNLFPGGS